MLSLLLMANFSSSLPLGFAAYGGRAAGDRRQNSGVGGRPPQFSAEAAQASSCTQEGSGRSSTATPAA